MREMKTLTLGGKTYEIVDAVARATLEAGVGVSSWNELTDRPFYEEAAEVELIPEQSLTLNELSEGTYFLEITPAPFVLVEGNDYRVVLDGSEYELTCVTQDGKQLLIHVVSDENGELATGSFQVVYVSPEYNGVEGGSVGVMLTGTEATHTVSIYRKTETVKTLDAKFIPMDAIDKRIEEYISSALEGDY